MEEVAVLSAGKPNDYIIRRALRKQISIRRTLEIISVHFSKVER